MLMKFKDSTNALSRPVENPMALKALSTNIINSNTLKFTHLSPMFSLSSLFPRSKRKRPTKKN